MILKEKDNEELGYFLGKILFGKLEELNKEKDNRVGTKERM